MSADEHGWSPSYGDGSSGWGLGYGDGESGWGHPYARIGSGAPGSPPIIPPGGGGGGGSGEEGDSGGGGPDAGAPAGVRYGDEGGYIITLLGNPWPAGPLFVRLRDAASDIWPSTVPGCWGADPGFGAELYPSRDMKRLRFVLPPLPLGVYDLLVFQGGSLLVTYEDAIEVVRRGRAWPQGYEFARKFPDHWPTGMRQPQFEAPAEANNRPPYGGWEAVAKALGRMFQDYAGAPCTRLRDNPDRPNQPDLMPGDEYAYVEATLGLPVAPRYFWVDGVHLRVFGVDHENRRLLLTGTDAEHPQTALATSIVSGTPIILDAREVRHPGFFVEPVYVALLEG